MRTRNRQPLVGQVVLGTLLVSLVALVGRLVYIHSYQGERLLARAARQQRSEVPLLHRRGLIVDCKGRIIAGTMVRKSVFADPKVIPDKEHAAAVLAEVLGLERAEMGQDLISAGDRRFMVIRRGVSDEEAERIKLASVPGLDLFDEPYRTYPMGETAAPIVGFVSPDGQGVSGLETQCNDWLRGENGIKAIIRDAGRKAIWLAEGGYRPARDGYHVVLTIDAEIQTNVEKQLIACMEKFKAQSAIGIVMNPKNGEILAMANVPGFDPNRYGDFSAARYRNRAITDPYEPGSTFKPFIAGGALAEGLVRLGEMFDCEMGTFVDGARVLHDHHPYGALSFEQVLVKSSNIGMAKIGKRMGNDRLYKYVKAFGFGEKTGIDLAGEDPGLVRPFARWGPFTTTSIPIGQEIGVTPLQMVRGYAVFANGGMLVTPHVIRAVLDADGQVVRDFADPPAPVSGPVMPENVIATVKDKLLVPVVNSGSSNAAMSRYVVFGKTGTAQIARKGGGGFEPNAYVSSFIGGAPARDPQLIVMVAVSRPNRSLGYYGNTVAAPVVREILSHSLAYLEIPPDRSEGIAETSLSAGAAYD